MKTRILHITLLLSVLFSSTSWVLHRHYCSDELVDIALMTVPESCHMDDTKDSCPDHSQTQDDCCTNEAELIKTELNYDLFQPQFKSFLFTQVFIDAFFVKQTVAVIDEAQEFLSLKYWQPPAPAAVSLPVIQQFLC